MAKYGGIFSSTTGLLDKFGPERVIDTPISETAFIGLGVGAAVEGMRPIVELMFADFFGLAMDQIYNHMAKIHFESGGNVGVPMVLMTATGGGYSDAEQHSQCLWGTFAHLPGMQVVVPSTPADAKGLMISAIRDDNPVVYMFHKGIMGLPWMAKNARSIAPVPEEPYETPIGKASAAREGGDATVVTVSLSVHHALDAADQMSAEHVFVSFAVDGMAEPTRNALWPPCGCGAGPAGTQLTADGRRPGSRSCPAESRQRYPPALSSSASGATAAASATSRCGLWRPSCCAMSSSCSTAALAQSGQPGGEIQTYQAEPTVASFASDDSTIEVASAGKEARQRRGLRASDRDLPRQNRAICA